MPRLIFILAAGAWLLLYSTLSCIAIVLHNAIFAFIFGSALGTGTASIFGIYRYFELAKEFKTLESRIVAIETRTYMTEIRTPVFVDGLHEKPTIH